MEAFFEFPLSTNEFVHNRHFYYILHFRHFHLLAIQDATKFEPSSRNVVGFQRHLRTRRKLASPILAGFPGRPFWISKRLRDSEIVSWPYFDTLQILRRNKLQGNFQSRSAELENISNIKNQKVWR